MSSTITGGRKNSETVNDPVALTISYDMGWNKRSSGHRYDSLSGHAFAIGEYTRRIIDCVVFSKKCNVCSLQLNQNKYKKSCSPAPSRETSSDISVVNGSAEMTIL